MGIQAASNIDMYLGILSFWGKTRYNALEYVKNGVVEKLKGLKQQALSFGKKDVLIKAVAYAMPIYTMACIKFPKKLCDDINATIANFW